MATATIKDVAQAAQVSTSAVSRILRGHPQYSYGVETQERVRHAAERLGYQAHPAARLLRQQQKTIIGLVIRLSIHPHSNRLLLAVRDEVRRCGYEPVLLEPEQLMPSPDSTPFLSAEMLAGVLSLDLLLEREVPNFYRWLSNKVPFLALYPVAVPQVEWIYTAQALGIEIAARHLADLGHHRVAFAQVSDSPFPSDYLKAEGWQKSVREYGFDPDPRYTLPIYLGRSIEENAAHVAQALEQLRPAPTALICPGDESALCVLGRLAAKGWKLPEQLSVIGFDGIHSGAYSNPPLTTIEHPVAKVAQTAVARLLQIIEVGAIDRPIQHQLIEPSLVVRGSTMRINSA